MSLPSPSPSTSPSPDRVTSPEIPLLSGWLKTTKDVLLVFEAARKGIIPRVTRRFNGLERDVLRSGVIIVFTHEESGISRWTDPYSWSPSRMLGNFMVYREKGDEPFSSDRPFACSDIRSTKNSSKKLDAGLERAIFGSWGEGQGFKAGGLMKKTISLVIDGTAHHIVSYYDPKDVRSGVLQTPSNMPKLRDLEISPEVLVNVHKLRRPPHTKLDREGKLVFIGEYDGATTTDPLKSGMKWIEVKMDPPPHQTPKPVNVKRSPSSNCQNTLISKSCLRRSRERHAAPNAYKPYDQDDAGRTVSHNSPRRQPPCPARCTPPETPLTPQHRVNFPWPYQVISSPSSPSSSDSSTAPSVSSFDPQLSPCLTTPPPTSKYPLPVEDAQWNFADCQWPYYTDMDALLAYQTAALGIAQPSPVYPQYTPVFTPSPGYAYTSSYL